MPILLIPAAVFAAPKNKNDPARVASAIVGYVYDGDTFAATVTLAEDIQISVRVRIINIDTPEMNAACQYEADMAQRAKVRLAEMLPVGAVVKLSEIKDDKYLGRIDARVKTVSGLDVGNVLIQEKLARPYSGGKRAPWCEPGMEPTAIDSESDEEYQGWMPAPAQKKLMSVLLDFLK